MAKHFLNSTTPKLIYDMLHCCASQNLLYIFRYIKEILQALSGSAVEVYKEYLLTRTVKIFRVDRSVTVEPAWMLLCTASYYSEIYMVKECFDLFHHCFKFDLNQLCRRMSNDIQTPLRWGIVRSDYELVEYLLDKFIIEQQELIYRCVELTYDEPLDTVRKREDICKLLLSRSRDILNETGTSEDWQCTGPITAFRIHPELVKFLIREGSDLRATTGNTNHGQTVIHCAVRYMSCPDFHDLCLFIFNKIGAIDLLKSVEGKWQCLLHHIFQLKKSDESFIKTLVSIPGFNINEVESSHGDNLILDAVRKNNSVVIIKQMIRLGVDVQYRNKWGETVLHLAARNGNLDILRYFLEIGCGDALSCRENEGNTPFLLSVGHLDLVKYLLSIEIDYLACNIHGNNIAHLGAFAKRKSADDFHEFVQILVNKDPEGRLFKTKNNERKTPLQIRLESPQSTILIKTLDQLIRLSSVNINDTDKDGNTLFLTAIKGRRNTYILKRLIHHGWTPNVRNLRSESSLLVAVRAKNLRAVECITSILDDTDNVQKISALQQVIRLLDSIKHLCKHDLEEGIQLIEIFIALLECLVGHKTDAGSNSSMWRNWKKLSIQRTTLKTSLPNNLSRSEATKYWSLLMHKEHFLVLLTSILIRKHASSIERMPILSIPSLTLQTYDKCTQYGQEHDMLCNWITSSDFQAGLLLKAFINSGMNIYDKDGNGNSIVHHISKFKSVSPNVFHDILYALIETDHCDILSMPNKKGQSPLHLVVYHHELYVRSLSLLESRSTFYCSSFNAQLRENINPIQLGAFDNEKNTILHMAVKGCRSMEFIKNLIELWYVDSANENLSNIPKMQNEDGNTFLHLIPENYTTVEYDALVELIIENKLGDCFLTRNHDGATPLHEAVFHLELLPQTVANLVSLNSNRNADSLSNENKVIVNFNAVDANGDTILHSAIDGKRSITLINQLISHGADTKVLDSNNNNLAHLSAAFGLIDHLKYFVQQGCDINEKNADGDNVLQCVFQDACEDVSEKVQYLLSAGVDKQNVNHNGQTALQVAIEIGINEEIILTSLRY